MRQAPVVSSPLYQDVVKITHVYFGPAADRFVSRQIRNHLHKEPSRLQKKDLATLINWIGLAMGLLVEDEQLIKRFMADLESLAANNRGPQHGKVT